MEKWIEKYQGIHPGAILDRQLKKRNLKQNAFARNIHVPAQTINAIIKGSRKMTPEVAVKIDEGLGFEESTMAVLQALYETRLVKDKRHKTDHPDFSKIRRILFWDTDFAKINWQQQRRAVVRRVWERGNEEEKQEIKRYYGADIVDGIVDQTKAHSRQPSFLRQKTS
jgi:addiction module HigA family antidote